MNKLAKEAAALEAKQRQRAEAHEQKATAKRDEVTALNDELRRTLYVSNMNLAQHTWKSAGGAERVRELLEQHRPKAGEADLRGFEWHYLDRLRHSELLTFKGHNNWVNSVAFSPDGNRLASGSRDNTVKLWDAQTGQELLSLKGHTAGVITVVFSPDGKRLVSVSGNPTGQSGELKVWDAQSGEQLLTLKGSSIGGGVALSANGHWLATSAHNPVTI